MAGGSAQFILAYVTLRVILIGLFTRVRPPAPADVRPFVDRYLIGNLLGAMIWRPDRRVGLCARGRHLVVVLRPGGRRRAAPGLAAAFQWGYGHLFVYGGIAATGVGIQLAIAAAGGGMISDLSGTAPLAAAGPRASDDLPMRLILGCGVATFLGANIFLRWSTLHGIADGVIVWRSAAAVVVVGIAVLPLTPPVVVGLTALVLFLVVAVERPRRIVVAPLPPS